MGNNTQELRRSVRKDLLIYAQKHPGSFKAHMVASAAVWLLAGRPGLSRQDQLGLVIRTHAYVADLASDGDPALAPTVAKLDALLTAVTAEGEAAVADAELMEAHASDFEAWAGATGWRREPTCQSQT